MNPIAPIHLRLKSRRWAEIFRLLETIQSEQIESLTNDSDDIEYDQLRLF